jgi:hypothetical protein
MRIDQVDEAFELAGSGVDRSCGPDVVHLTDVTRYIGAKTGLGPNTAGQWDLDAAAEAGFIWEDLLSLVLGRRLGVAPGEVELDGIVGSPDGIGPDPWEEVPLAVQEYKCTWRSVRNGQPDGVWHWMAQVKGYCRMVGTHVVVFRVLYLMGDYKGSGPLRRTFRLEFDQKEIEENWAMILRHREEARKARGGQG